jgi:hypothetical protein
MDRGTYEQFVEMLDSMPLSRRFVFLNALSLFVDCCKEDSNLSAILIVKKDTFVDNESVLNIAALNADMDDAYEILEMAYNKVAEDIKEGAPDRGSYN